METVGGRIRGGSWRGGQREGLSPPPAGPVPRLAAVLFRRCGPPTLCTCATGKRSSGAQGQLRARVRGWRRQGLWRRPERWAPGGAQRNVAPRTFRSVRAIAGGGTERVAPSTYN